MKIAMLGHKRIPSREGGIEIVVGELSQRMAAHGHTVCAYNRKSDHIAGKQYEKINEYNGVRIKWVKTPNASKLNAIVYSFFATVRAICGGYDILHYHAEGPAAMIPLAKLCGKKCVATIHGLDWQRAKWGGFATKFLKYGEKCAAKYADEVIVLSKNVQQYFLATYGRETKYIPNGISAPEHIGAEILHEKYRLDKDGYLLFLGRLVPEKGVHYLIHAYQTLDTDKKLVIAGGASHTNEYEHALHEMAGDDVVFTGFVQGDELGALYSNAYLYCLPSDLEGMPISLLEAMSYGCACLTSDIPECTEVCGENAVYFQKGNERDLAEKLAALLADSATVERLRRDSAAYICDKFNWDEVTAKTLELYEGLLS